MFRNKSTFIFCIFLLSFSTANAHRSAVGLEDITDVWADSSSAAPKTDAVAKEVSKPIAEKVEEKSEISAPRVESKEKIAAGFLTTAEVVSLHQTVRQCAGHQMVIRDSMNSANKHFAAVAENICKEILDAATPVARRILKAKDQWGLYNATGRQKPLYSQFFLESRQGESADPLRDLPEGYGSELWHMTPLMGHYLEEIKGKEVADVGCATGISVIFSKLYAAPKEVLAIDLDPSNLKLLLTHFEDLHQEEDPRLNIDGIALGLGKFPSEVKLAPNSRDAILISNVLHHMDPDQVRATLENAAAALRPGGKIYIQALTPKAAKRGRFRFPLESDSDKDNPWPFYMDEVEVGTFRHPFNLAILRRELARVGLVPERQGYYYLSGTREDKLPLAGEPLKHMDWRDMVGIIAVKPANQQS